jgi:hypothetical protein
MHANEGQKRWGRAARSKSETEGHVSKNERKRGYAGESKTEWGHVSENGVGQ